jgi:hypothetical protein
MTNSFGAIPNYWDLSSNVAWNPGAAKELGKTKGGNMFGWDDAAVAGVGAIGGLISGFGQQRTAASINNAQMAAQADALNQGIRFQRDSAKANMAMGMFPQLFGSTTGSDLDFGRQALAQRMNLGEFMPKQSGLGREQTRWETAFQNSPSFQEASQRERLGRLKETIAAARAQPTGMFGRIAQAPIESLMV